MFRPSLAAAVAAVTAANYKPVHGGYPGGVPVQKMRTPRSDIGLREGLEASGFHFAGSFGDGACMMFVGQPLAIEPMATEFDGTLHDFREANRVPKGWDAA